MINDSFVRARIDSGIKEQASKALEAMGLSVSDAIRLLMISIANEKRLPFEVKIPSSVTRRAMDEFDAGKGKTFKTTEDLMAYLNEKD